MVADLRAAETIPVPGLAKPPEASSPGQGAPVPRASGTPKASRRRSAPARARGPREPIVIDWHGFHVALRNAALAATQSRAPLSLLMLELVPGAPEPPSAHRASTARCIQALAAGIAMDLDPMCALARYGDERLAMILMGADLARALAEARRIGCGIASADGADLSGRAAIGVAQFRDDESLGHLIERVSAAAGRARLDGRQIVVAERGRRRRPWRPADRSEATLCPCGLQATPCVCGLD